MAKFEEGTESEIAHYYNDVETMRLVNAMANIIGIPVEEVWEAYGGFLIQFTMETGWDELLRAMASDLEGFLDSLDSLHYFIDHVVYQTKLRGPSFRCEPQPDGTLLLHYYSKRSGLYPIVKGTSDSRAVGVVGVLVNTNTAKSIDSFKQFMIRITPLRMKKCGSTPAPNIFVAYAPTSSCEKEEAEAFSVDPEKFYIFYKEHTFYKAIGYFNTEIGPR
ncbi:hypothetical protein RB195_023950 [Necator americanus]|uniref:Heme NO-binding domain-containing protein n=1 Tax=Necator americanus TaxID=51031 RepID=A0ABR1EL94_NECAM